MAFGTPRCHARGRASTQHLGWPKQPHDQSDDPTVHGGGGGVPVLQHSPPHKATQSSGEGHRNGRLAMCLKATAHLPLQTQSTKGKLGWVPLAVSYRPRPRTSGVVAIGACWLSHLNTHPKTTLRRDTSADPPAPQLMEGPTGFHDSAPRPTKPETQENPGS